jgi:hypothetical protein
MEVLARLGLLARALIYLLLGGLTFAIAFGARRSEADQRGAFQELATNAGGLLVLWVIAIGLVGYSLWRLAEAAFGVAGEGKRTGPRLQSLGRAIIYAFLAASAFSVIAGRHENQAERSQDLSARVMAHSGGRLLVGAIGVAIVVVGIVLVGQGLYRSFEKYLRLGDMGPRTRTVVRALGVVGAVARGLIVTLSGILVVDAAVRFDPAKASGVDSALRTLAQQPLGQALLVVAGIGLVAFGVYGIAEARWHVT